MKMSEEVWKDIYFIENGVTWDFRGVYQISNFGRVKSLERYDKLNHKRNEKILSNGKSGIYDIVGLICKDGKRKVFLIHRLVAHMFIPNEKNKPEVDHIIPLSMGGTNNYINLRWVTNKENKNNENTLINYKKANKGEKNPRYNKKHTEEWKKNKSMQTRGRNNPNAKKVCQYDLNGELIKIWNCAKDISDSFGWNYNTFYNHLNGRYSNEYKGFIWKSYESGEINE